MSLPLTRVVPAISSSSGRLSNVVFNDSLSYKACKPTKDNASLCSQLDSNISCLAVNYLLVFMNVDWDEVTFCFPVDVSVLSYMFFHRRSLRAAKELSKVK